MGTESAFDVLVKARALEAKGRDVVHLEIGEPDFRTPGNIVREGVKALEEGWTHYGPPAGLPDLRKAIADWYHRKFDVELCPNTEVLPLIGSKEGIAHFAYAVAGPGDVAIVPEPGYQCYMGGSICAGAEPFVVPLLARNNFLVELDQVPRDVLRRARVVFLNYPNNPTSAVAPRGYLERTVAVCREHGIALVYDNPYVELTFDGYRAPSIFEVDGAREVAVEFHSCSKSFSMTGWRLGWAVGGRELIGALTAIKSYHDTGPFLAIQRAAVEVLDHAEALAAPAAATFQARRDAAVAAFRRQGFEVTPPRATMYLWIPLPEGIASLDFAREALDEQGVIVLPGSAFGASAEGYFRVALTVGEDRLAEAAERMGRVLARA